MTITDLPGLDEVSVLVQILQRGLHHQPVEGSRWHQGKPSNLNTLNLKHILYLSHARFWPMALKCASILLESLSLLIRWVLTWWVCFAIHICICFISGQLWVWHRNAGRPGCLLQDCCILLPPFKNLQKEMILSKPWLCQTKKDVRKWVFRYSYMYTLKDVDGLLSCFQLFFHIY